MGGTINGRNSAYTGLLFNRRFNMLRRLWLPLTAILTAVLVSMFFSAHWTVRQMVTAAQGRDTEQFSRYVDYAALRDSLKAQFAQSMAEQAPQDDNPFAAFGRMIGRAVVDPLIDASVTPAAAMAMVVEPTEVNDASSNTTTPPPRYDMHYRNWDSVDATTTRRDGKAFSMRFRREGMWSWKWVGISN
jgi:hypothetical protein